MEYKHNQIVDFFLHELKKLRFSLDFDVFFHDEGNLRIALLGILIVAFLLELIALFGILCRFTDEFLLHKEIIIMKKILAYILNEYQISL